MSEQEKIIHHDAIIETRKKMGMWFGNADGIFAGHPEDEKNSKLGLKFAAKSFITLDELTELTLGYYRKHGFTDTEHVNRELSKITIKYNSLLSKK